jgi:hypothetical protein
MSPKSQPSLLWHPNALAAMIPGDPAQGRYDLAALATILLTNMALGRS